MRKRADPVTKKALGEFGKRVEARMSELVLTDSEVGKRSGLGRDNIHAYMVGRDLPDKAGMKALAIALGVSAQDLWPSGTYPVEEANHELPEYICEIRSIGTSLSPVRLRVNDVMSLGKAIKIYDIMIEPDGPQE